MAKRMDPRSNFSVAPEHKAKIRLCIPRYKPLIFTDQTEDSTFLPEKQSSRPLTSSVILSLWKPVFHQTRLPAEIKELSFSWRLSKQNQRPLQRGGAGWRGGTAIMFLREAKLEQTNRNFLAGSLFQATTQACILGVVKKKDPFLRLAWEGRTTAGLKCMTMQ